MCPCMQLSGFYLSIKSLKVIHQDFPSLIIYTLPYDFTNVLFHDQKFSDGSGGMQIIGKNNSRQSGG